jgi:hypothetical protein
MIARRSRENHEYVGKSQTQEFAGAGVTTKNVHPMRILLKRQVVYCLLMIPFPWGTVTSQSDDPLSYSFKGHYGQVEVGGRFAGAEFHESRPLPARISFYYPVANSIDLSTDYWKRGASRPMAIATSIDGNSPRWIGREPWDYVLSPHTVCFFRVEDGLRYSLRFEFGLHEPIMVFSFTVVNTTARPKRMGAYVHLRTVLRTCQTYARYDSALVSYESTDMASIARFDEPQTASASVFVENVGEPPSGWELDADRLAVTDSGTCAWSGSRLASLPTAARKMRALSAFTYNRLLGVGDSLGVVLVIGSCKNDEASAVVGRLGKTWSEDVAQYSRFIRDQALRSALLSTGDAWVDRSAFWAAALLAANAHYIDGSVVPMPCPAEYNFFFTHDVLLTDLAAVAFDPERVKNDLTFIASHARDNVIPHAYYWRDDGFKTEYCTPDNWNHLWFILTVGSYLRHTMDDSLGNLLFPMVTRSISDALQRLKEDHLMHALAPDWWDIGKREGARAYMTILVIRALREYNAINAILGKKSSDLAAYERTAEEMQVSLPRQLWDEQARYLMNLNGSEKDPHYYMGSLLGPAFGILDTRRSRQLVRTAERELLAENLGIRTVMPADFHTDSVRAYFHFVGNEAGDPFLYANGGVWPHNNAWYTLALRATGRLDDAFRFYRETMTLDGIAHSPMGQPAMYEYRYSDRSSREYGRIDKPSFLWAAGFSLLAGYRLVGIDDNEWNLSFAGVLPSNVETARCVLEFGGRKEVLISGKGRGLKSFMADGMSVPSLVVPLDIRNTRKWTLRLGSGKEPYLVQTNALLRSAGYFTEGKELRLTVSSFSGHTVTAAVSAPARPTRATVDGNAITTQSIKNRSAGGYELLLRFEGTGAPQHIRVQF